MTKYMLLFRNEGVDFYSLPPAELQGIVSNFDQWFKTLSSEGRLVTKGRLQDEGGVTLRRKGGRLQVDGPYCETKEAIGGFFMIEARDYDEATRIAEQCPLLPFGASVEVRELRFTDEYPCKL